MQTYLRLAVCVVHCSTGIIGRRMFSYSNDIITKPVKKNQKCFVLLW